MAAGVAEPEPLELAEEDKEDDPEARLDAEDVGVVETEPLAVASADADAPGDAEPEPLGEGDALADSVGAPLGPGGAVTLGLVDGEALADRRTLFTR